MSSKDIIGTCSCCGGPVYLPPLDSPNRKSNTRAMCLDCGAVAIESYGPVIQTKKDGPEELMLG